MEIRAWLSRTSLLVIPLFCSACALPKAAPVAVNVEEARTPLEADFFVVPLLPPIVQLMGNRKEIGFPSAFRLENYRPSIALKPGDVISVTIFEVGSSPTFGSNSAPQTYGQLAPMSQVASTAPLREPGSFASEIKGSSPRLESRSFTLMGFHPKAVHQAASGFEKPVVLASNGDIPLTVAQIIPPSPTPVPPTPAPAPPPAAASPATPSAAPASTRTLPPMTVESDGDIFVPYGGRVDVGGLSPIEAADAIKRSLTGRAFNPQVIVSFISNGTNTATVGGEANRPGPVVLTLRGERLLDVIGQAGGSKWPASDTDVDILRGHSTAKVNLQTIVENPSENITVRPNDEIFMTHNPRSFTVLGATQKVSQYTFDVPRVSLAEAVGRAGGAIDTTGNPAAIYLFREEPAQLATAVLNVAATIRPVDRDNPVSPIYGSRVKIVYKIDMNSGEGYFLARRITIVDKDVILIANAEGTQLLKLFTLVRGVTGAANDLNLVGNSSSK